MCHLDVSYADPVIYVYVFVYVYMYIRTYVCMPVRTYCVELCITIYILHIYIVSIQTTAVAVQATA